MLLGGSARLGGFLAGARQPFGGLALQVMLYHLARALGDAVLGVTALLLFAPSLVSLGLLLLLPCPLLGFPFSLLRRRFRVPGILDFPQFFPTACDHRVLAHKALVGIFRGGRDDVVSRLLKPTGARCPIQQVAIVAKPLTQQYRGEPTQWPTSPEPAILTPHEMISNGPRHRATLTPRRAKR